MGEKNRERIKKRSFQDRSDFIEHQETNTHVSHKIRRTRQNRIEQQDERKLFTDEDFALEE